MKTELAWPRSDREWMRNHIGCNVTTCPNARCKTSGECVEIEAQRAKQARENSSGK